MSALDGKLPSIPHSVVAQTFSGSAEGSDEFIKCLDQSVRPEWQRLREVGQLVSNQVYRKVGQRDDRPGVEWSVLIVSAGNSDRSARAFLKGPQQCARTTGAALARADLMRPTPASFHPAPGSRPKRPDLAFIVEFITVNEEPAALGEYRETMRTSIGPAIARLVKENQFFSMIGLETVKVLQSSSSASEWNQLHIRGYYPEFGATPAAMTRYMQEANPAMGDFQQVFRRLDSLRPKPRDDVAQEVEQLSL